MTAPVSPPQIKPPFRWGRLVLFVSLALNLAVLGVVGGAALGRFGGPERAEFAARDIGFGLFAEALEEEDRRALRRGYVGAKPDIRAERRQMRDDLGQLLTGLRTDPFDAAAFRATLQVGMARGAQRQELGQTLLLDRLNGMSAAQRAGLADRLEKSLRRRGDRKRDH
ncbi:Heavy-metal resistance [Pseudorhodobacter antarcticus]|uniref:Heavy-metal resistance n=1 Tax=Pseudorhodobacter antarcticus TaxID=1077947 RepID=A0A1H8F933_9RHOB|nr:periplasmic heavy metal sensor [Pseudorhodobacter antarcticus]SEN27558.1 Heavy-metal resistance [Pseudorhodobacter antarcticus]